MRNLIASSAFFAAILGAPTIPHLSALATAQTINPTICDATPVIRQTPGHPGVVVLVLDGPFTRDESAKIQRAITEWNHALFADDRSMRRQVIGPGRCSPIQAADRQPELVLGGPEREGAALTPPTPVPRLPAPW
jgi:hypothetical protein